MAYQETKTVGYGSRVKNSCGGVVVGIGMFLAGTALLWWNEGNSVKTTKALEEAQGVAVHVDDVSKLDPQYNSQLIHATAEAKTTDILTDDAYGVSVNAIRLRRTVEYYQWVEHSETETKDKLGGSQEQVTTYTYKKEWVSTPTNSSEFHDPAYQNCYNGVIMNVENETKEAQTVTFGAYTLPTFMVGRISNSYPAEVAPQKAMLKEWDRSIGLLKDEINSNYNMAEQAQLAQTATDSTATEATADTTATDAAAANAYDSKYVHVSGNTIYFGKSSAMPEVGDVRVKFTYTAPTTISIIGMVNGNTFTKYTATNGKEVSAVADGTKSMEEMFQTEHESNKMMTWVWRIVGILLVIGGLKGVFGFVSTLLKVVPFMSSIANFGIGIICTVIGLAWSLLVIAIAWIAARPVLGISILVIMAGIVGFFIWKGKSKKQPDEVTAA